LLSGINDSPAAPLRAGRQSIKKRDDIVYITALAAIYGILRARNQLIHGTLGARHMTVTIDLKPEMEASLSALAAAQGVDLARLVERMLENQLPTMAAPMSIAERIAAWRTLPNLPSRPPLSDEAMSRESIYDARG